MRDKPEACPTVAAPPTQSPYLVLGPEGGLFFHQPSSILHHPSSICNPRWGLLFRTANHPSHRQPSRENTRTRPGAKSRAKPGCHASRKCYCMGACESGMDATMQTTTLIPGPVVPIPALGITPVKAMTRKKILVVDDNVVIQKMLSMKLK